MKRNILAQSMLTTLAVFVLLAANQMVFAQSDLSGKADLAETEKRLIYSRAFEAILWAGPAVAVLAQIEAGHRDLGAGPYDIIYTGKPMDYRWGGITYNNQSPYWLAGFSVKDGPVVVDIPPAREDARFFGSIHDVWFLPLEDFGPAGADEGKGGKYLVLPPGYKGKVPNGYIVLPSGSYLNFIPGRTILRDSGSEAWAAAVDYIKTIRIYPLAEAADPEPTHFIQGAQKEYAAQPNYSLKDFELINRLVQDEPVREHDKVMYGLLAEIGIQKGKPFKPNEDEAGILERAAKDVQALSIKAIQSGSAFNPFWKSRGWGAFAITPEIAAGGASFVLEDRVSYQERMTNWFYFSGGMYKRYHPTKPSSTFYLMTAKDADGNPLEASKTYRINVPANAPMRDFWSVIAYGLKSRTFANYPRFTVASSDEGVKPNDDGSTDLYIGPKPVEGFEANTVITNPDEEYFLMFRLYGAEPSLWEKNWKLGDPELVK